MRLGPILALALLALPAPSLAFSYLIDFGGPAPSAAQLAPRWATPGGGPVVIEAAVEQDLIQRLIPGDLTPDERARLRVAVVDAFRGWESPALRFEVTLDGFAVGAAASSVTPLRMLAVESHAFPFPGFTGVAIPESEFDPQRHLTNGMLSPGERITEAEIFFDIGRFAQFATAFDFGLEAAAAAIQRFFMHEIGHTIGLGHPNGNGPFFPNTNYDTDFDPTNPMVIDPLDPFAELVVSIQRNNQAVMSDRSCGPNVDDVCVALLLTDLTNDDIGGRNVLYPARVPEPSILVLGAPAGALAMAAAAARRRRSALRPR